MRARSDEHDDLVIADRRPSAHLLPEGRPLPGSSSVRRGGARSTLSVERQVDTNLDALCTQSARANTSNLTI